MADDYYQRALEQAPDDEVINDSYADFLEGTLACLVPHGSAACLLIRLI